MSNSFNHHMVNDFITCWIFFCNLLKSLHCWTVYWIILLNCCLGILIVYSSILNLYDIFFSPRFINLATTTHLQFRGIVIKASSSMASGRLPGFRNSNVSLNYVWQFFYFLIFCQKRCIFFSGLKYFLYIKIDIHNMGTQLVSFP